MNIYNKVFDPIFRNEKNIEHQNITKQEPGINKEELNGRERYNIPRIDVT